jgi:hypothetical protein
MAVKIKFDPVPYNLKSLKYPTDKADKLLKELEKYMKGELSRELIGRMEDTTEGWQHKPKFVSVYSEPRNKANMQILVKPTGRHTLQWVRVSEGTGPRGWTSQNTMVFPRDYTPKTPVPTSGFYGGPGLKSGDIVHTRTIQSHRIEPRKFSKFIADSYKSKFQFEVREIFVRVLR